MSVPRTRIMYIQRGREPGRIGRVRLSKSGRTLFYGELVLEPISGGYKANFIDRAAGEYYWVSGPRADGQDTLYPGVVEIDGDVREEYWRVVRHQPRGANAFHSLGVHAKHATR